MPEGAGELVRAVRDFDRVGSFRLASHVIKAPDPVSPGSTYPTDTDRAIWNPDGTTADDFFQIAFAFFAQASAGTSPTDTINDPLQQP